MNRGNERVKALKNGSLIDISDRAKEGRINYPVAISSNAWASCVKVPEGVLFQSEISRLQDVLWLLYIEIRKSEGVHILDFIVYVRNDNKASKPVDFKAVLSPDEKGEPVITILLPEEDLKRDTGHGPYH